MQFYKYTLLLVIFLIVSACQTNVRESLGLKKEAPDEFMVLSNPPLTIPPDFDKLENPSYAKSRKKSTIEEAKQTLFKKGAEKRNTESVGEQIFLKKAGTHKANPNIREQLNKDNEIVSPEQKGEKGFFKKMIELTTKKKDPLVDPNLERERLIKNKAEGKPPTEGEVPTLEPEKETVLDQLLE